MQTLYQIVTDLKAYLEPHFPTVRITNIQTVEQFLQEAGGINPDKLPAALIVFDGFTGMGDFGIHEYRLTIVYLDRFRSGADERVLSLNQFSTVGYKFSGGAKILELISPDGTDLNGVFLVPTDCQSAAPAEQFAALAFGIAAKQGN